MAAGGAKHGVAAVVFAHRAGKREPPSIIVFKEVGAIRRRLGVPGFYSDQGVHFVPFCRVPASGQLRVAGGQDDEPGPGEPP
jgi:alkyl hydroperoxide reductase subunit AhpF